MGFLTVYSEKYLDKSLHGLDWWHCNTIGKRVEAAVDDIDGWNFGFEESFISFKDRRIMKIGWEDQF